MKKDEFLARVQESGALGSRAEAERRSKAVVSALAERPRYLKMTPDAFLQHIGHALDAHVPEAQRTLRAVYGALTEAVASGEIADFALRGADVCVARTMARDAVVFACANPVPEIWPWDATEAGARVVATGRSGFPNQLNNSLVFPGLFRGALDDILPRMDEWDVHLRVAVAAATEAQAQGVTRVAKSRAEIHDAASRSMWNARETTRLLMRAGLIRDMPSEGA